MRRHARLLAAYLAQFVKSRLSYRGDFVVDTIAVLLALSDLAVGEPDVVSVDVNPLVVERGRPIAVDALVEVRA